MTDNFPTSSSGDGFDSGMWGLCHQPGKTRGVGGIWNWVAVYYLPNGLASRQAFQQVKAK
ncbi:MAG: hypothetical protein BVN35_11625 [Proteobacteria bacterium ST_bin11]|nr:MAG: hypothetical protein BVN35_11625 [Proteobacteria bacterium ST_bin11]